MLAHASLRTLPVFLAPWFLAIPIPSTQAQVTTIRISVDSNGTQADAESFTPAISADGRFAAFVSEASNLVLNDTNDVLDVFVYDRLSSRPVLISLSTSGAQGDDDSQDPAISGDGRYVAFVSYATTLVPNDTNDGPDIFVRDTVTGQTTRVSVASSGTEADGNSYDPAISADGRFVTFHSYATNLVAGDSNGMSDIFVHDRLTGITSRVSINSAGDEANAESYNPDISANGRYVTFWSAASNLVPDDTNGARDVFVHDRQTGQTSRISVDSSGAEANSDSYDSAISADGRVVAFWSAASNLVSGDTNGSPDVFVHELPSGTTTRISVGSSGTQGNFTSYIPSISADGRFVAFTSGATNLVAGDTNNCNDIFLHDRLTGKTDRISVDSLGAGGNAGSGYGMVSGDGRFVVYQSFASNLVSGDTNHDTDVFLCDSGVRLPVSSCYGDGSAGNCPCGNNGIAEHGCDNSAGTGGASLAATGSSSSTSDTFVLTSSPELANAFSIFLQGDGFISATHFGDGLRCVSGNLKRLFLKSAAGGTVYAPQFGDPSVSAQSAALGDPIPMGATRHYQVYYRDPSSSFCSEPFGNTWNVSSALSAVWTE